jgi:hypothetical protein
MSPSLASSPIRSTFPDTKASGRSSPAPANGGKPATAKGRQNSIQTTVEKGASPAPTKQNGTVAGTPDLAAAAVVTGKTITEVKASMKESATNSKGEHVLEDVDKEDLDLIGGIVVGERKNSTMKREEPETNGDAMQGIQTTTVTLTKSGRASKPSTPALQQFPEPVRSRSSRNTIETASSNSNKRSHKKGAGAAAQQLIISQQQNNQASEADEGSSMQGSSPFFSNLTFQFFEMTVLYHLSYHYPNIIMTQVTMKTQRLARMNLDIATVTVLVTGKWWGVMRETVRGNGFTWSVWG